METPGNCTKLIEQNPHKLSHKLALEGIRFLVFVKEQMKQCYYDPMEVGIP